MFDHVEKQFTSALKQQHGHVFWLRLDVGRCLQLDTLASSPSMPGYNLTTKVAGKTVTLYVRKNLVSKALEMGKRYKRLWGLIQKLSKINWEILKIENQ